MVIIIFLCWRKSWCSQKGPSPVGVAGRLVGTKDGQGAVKGLLLSRGARWVSRGLSYAPSFCQFEFKREGTDDNFL